MTGWQAPDTAPLYVNVLVRATDGRTIRDFPDCKRFFALGPARFIGVPEGWHPRGWQPQDDTEAPPAGSAV